MTNLTHTNIEFDNTHPAKRPVPTVFALFAVGIALSGCAITDRLSQVGAAPPLSPIQNTVAAPGYKAVSLPMPQGRPEIYPANSLWRSGAKAFFEDQRATEVGDILTVNIAIEDQAELSNMTQRSRSSSEDANLSSLLGYEASLAQLLPEAVSTPSLANFGSTSNSMGSGNVDREESIRLTVAAIVNQVLPNGNLVIEGRQEVRVNFEVRELLIAGVVRPEDIQADNTIDHTQIAEARISYGGRGHLTDVQQSRYGQQVYDILMPF